MSNKSGIWQRLPDFNHLTWKGGAVCSNCGSPKRKTEESIFRPNTFDDIDGHPDFCEGCIIEAADMLGLVTADKTGAIREIQAELSDVLEQLAASRDALATVTRENVRLQDTIDDLNAPVEVPFFLDDGDDDVYDWGDEGND